MVRKYPKKKKDKRQTSFLWRLGDAAGDMNSGVRLPDDRVLWSTKRKGLSQKCLSQQAKSVSSLRLDKNSITSESTDWLQIEESLSKDLSSLLSDQIALPLHEQE
jgi:hypothetical protein